MRSMVAITLSLLLVSPAALAQGGRARAPQAASPVKPGEPEKRFPQKMIWVLKEFNGKPVPVAGDFTFMLDDNFRASGTSGCNSWSATVYPSRGQRIAVGPIAITRNTCDKAKTDFERIYLGSIHAGPFWDMEGSDLVFKGPAGPLKFKNSI